MAVRESLSAGARGYRALGLIANPFVPDERQEEIAIGLQCMARVNELLTVVDRMAESGEVRPVWVDKARKSPKRRHLTAQAALLGLATENEELGFLPIYVPLDAMRLGKTRSALSFTAEHMASISFDRTLARYIEDEVMDDPDEDLPEWESVRGEVFEEARQRFHVDPVQAVERYFGPCVSVREEAESIDELLKISGARLRAQEKDPVEEQDAEEEAGDGDPFPDALVTPRDAALDPTVGSGDDDLGAAGGEDEGSSVEADEQREEHAELRRRQAFSDYVVAHVKKHVSPVLARGLLAFRVQGLAAMSQELKITKAPRKTLVAFARFLGHRYRKVLFLYDRLEMWKPMPEDLKSDIVAALFKLRMALRDSAVVVILAKEGTAPELEEQFAGAHRVVWDMGVPDTMIGPTPTIDRGVIAGWIEAATLESGEPMDLEEGPLGELMNESQGDLRAFVTAARAAIDDAASRGVGLLDRQALESGHEAWSPESC